MVNIKLELDAREDMRQIEEYISKDSVYYANKTIEEIGEIFDKYIVKTILNRKSQLDEKLKAEISKIYQ